MYGTDKKFTSNIYEWNTETYRCGNVSYAPCTIRGGYRSNSNANPSHRKGRDKANSVEHFSFRVILYL